MITHDSSTAERDDSGSPAAPTGAPDGMLGGTPEPHAATVQQVTRVPAASSCRRWGFSPAAAAFVSANAALLAMAVFAIASFGSLGLAIGYYLRGEKLLVDAPQKSFGAAAPGETVRVSFKLANKNDVAIRILGCKAACNCTVPCELPLALAPGESKDFTLTIQMPSQRGRGGRRLDVPFTLFTSSVVQPRINLAVRGELSDKPAETMPTP